MKTLFIFLLTGFLSASTAAQFTQQVRIIFKGITKTTKNYQVMLDTASYFSNTSNGINNTITVSSLPTGQHVVKVYALKSNNARYNRTLKHTQLYAQNFELRQGYDMDILVRVNGRVQFSERTAVVSNAKTPMAAAKFSQLLQTVRTKWSQALKGETVSEAFNNPDNYFTTEQVRQLLLLLSSEGDRLDLAKLSYRSVTDSTNFTKLFTVFKIQSSKDELNNYLRAQGWNITDGTAKTAMTDAKFNQLLQTVRNKWSQALKGETINEAFNNPDNFFSTTQIRQLLSLISSESDRLDLAKLSYRSVTDPGNFTQVYDLLATQTSRDDLANYIRTEGWKNDPLPAIIKTPMTDAEFNQLLQTVRTKWSQSLKGETINDAFQKPNAYFRTAQVRQLLTLINSESDRLDLAKLSYRTVTDSTNFTQLYDLFTTTANKEELNNYLRSQGWNIGSGTTLQPGVRTPMSDQEFNNLVLNVRGQFIQYLKKNYERQVFSDTTKYFTTGQIRELLSLIKDEDDDRIELAKLAYRSTTDKNNYTLLLDLFNTQVKKDELVRYIRDYRE